VDTFSDLDNTLDEHLSEMDGLARAFIASEKEMFLGIGLNIQILSTTFARRVESRIGALETSLPHYAAAAVARMDGRFDALAGELRLASTDIVAAAGRRLDNAQAAVAAHDPERILAMGFSIVRDDRGRIVRSSAALKRGDTINISLSKGVVNAIVKNTHGKK